MATTLGDRSFADATDRVLKARDGDPVADVSAVEAEMNRLV